MKYVRTIALAFTLTFFALPATTFAALTADFESVPLFQVSDFLPGDVTDGNVVVGNTGESVESAYVESVNGYDPDQLGSQLRVRIFEGATILYDDVFADFLSAGPVPLSTVSAHAQKTYRFEVSFINSADDDYQEKSLGFDLCVGFVGGPLTCGGTVVSDLENDLPSNDGGGGGGGGPLNAPLLTISNEEASAIILEEGTAVIEWDTNLLATSQVVYGLKSGAPYSLNMLTLPYFGYPSGTVEDGTKVTHHIVMLTGLTPGETYVFRAVSRASPPTLSFEREFAFTEDAQARAIAMADATNVTNVPPSFFASEGNAPVGTLSLDSAQISGNVDIHEVVPVTEEVADTNEEVNNLTAAAFLSLPSWVSDFLMSWQTLLTLFVSVMVTLWFLGLLRRRSRETEYEAQTRS